MEKKKMLHLSYKSWESIPKLEQIEVEKETDKFITLIGGRRIVKESDREAYGNSLKEVSHKAIRQLDRQIEESKNRIEYQTKSLKTLIAKRDYIEALSHQADNTASDNN